MGLIYTENKEKELYAAYDMTVYGAENKYNWTIYPDKPTETVYTTLRIEKNGEDIVNVVVGNRCIFEKVFLRTIDNFLYWIDKDDPDSYSIEKAVFKSLCVANSLFNYNIENRKYQEQKELENKKRAKAIEAEEQRKFAVIQEWCEKKGYLFKQTWKSNYVINILNDKVTEMFEIADADRMEGLIQFMQEHPDISDARLVISGELEEIYNKVCYK